MPFKIDSVVWEHLKKGQCLVQIQSAVISTIADGKYRTGDLGGKSTCSDFTKAIIDRL